MAKKQKIKNFKIEQDELHPMTIGIFENRKKSSFSIFVIMTLFILTVVFLPYISNYVNSYLAGEDPVHKGSVITPIIPNEDPEEDETFYYFDDNPQVVQDDLQFDSFALDLEAKALKCKVTNNKKTTIKMGEQNYYLELFNEDKTLLERLKFIGSTNMTSGSYEEYVLNLSEETLLNAKSFMLHHISEDGYPPVELNTDKETGEQVLVCKRDSEVATYTFQENLLKKFESVYDYTRTAEILDEEYVPFYQEYQRKASNYAASKGITSTFFMGSEGFNVTTEVNLSEANRTYIFNADTFALDTEARVVVFDMEAQGFTCE